MVRRLIERHPVLHPLARTAQSVAAAARVVWEGQVLFVDSRVRPVPRYGYGRPPHVLLYEVIARRRAAYAQLLERFLDFREELLRIPRLSFDLQEPCWGGINLWIPGLDAVALYGLVRLVRPRRYVEIGSGYSTRFVRRAVRDGGLATQIISIDPRPRVRSDVLCDRIIRQRVEDVDLRLFEELEAGDILFVDGSHRCFMNSDVTVVFLDILPRLRPQVLVHFHDIFLPEDYPLQWGKRYYSEQYLLAVWLLAGEEEMEILLPNAFVSRDPELSRILDPLWEDPHMRGVNRRGASFWIRMMRPWGEESV